jgi:hypothetical protein
LYILVYVGSAGIRRRVGAQAASPHHCTIGTSNPILACAEEKCRDIGTVDSASVGGECSVGGVGYSTRKRSQEPEGG